MRNGQRVEVRESHPEDAHEIGLFLDGLCAEARRLRFFTGAVDVERVTGSLVRTGVDRIGLVAVDDTGAIVAHAVAIELEPGRAEVALEVADRLHGQGLGTILIERLAELCEQRGMATLVAQVLPENRAMLDVLRDGFEARVAWAEGVDLVEFPASAWRDAHERFREMFDDSRVKTRADRG